MSTFLIFLILIVAVASPAYGIPQMSSTGRFRCKIVPDGTANCSSVIGRSCEDSPFLEGLLRDNVSKVLVCRKFSLVPSLTDIVVGFRNAIAGFDCSNNIANKSVCFIKDLNESRSCPEIAGITPPSARVSCADQTALKTRLLQPTKSANLCFVNTTSATSLEIVERRVELVARVTTFRLPPFGN